MSAPHSSDHGAVRRGEPPARPEAEGAGSPFSLSLDAMYDARDERERHDEATAVDAARQERDRRAGDRSRFDAVHLTDADRRAVLSKVESAFKGGQREVMLVSFPSGFCTDGGRRINNQLPGWPDTLPDGARVFFTFWQEALRPGGFGLGARILTFPGGVLGEAGLFVTWPQNAAEQGMTLDDASIGRAGTKDALAGGRRGPRSTALGFQEAAPRTALWQVATTFPPLLALLAAMYAGLPMGWWSVLILALPAAGLVVRVFALQHDCGHGSLFRLRRTNDAVGRLCSLFTLTPYGHWRRQHAGHHAVWNDLDRRDRGADIYSTCATVAEYREMDRWQRLRFRAARHPLVAQLLLPPLVFLLLYRFAFDAPPAWNRERRGVHLTNLALAAAYGGLCLVLGFWHVASVLLAVMIPASIAGVWLFSVQHRFEGVRWSRHAEWDPVTASLEGSSYLRLPRILRWFTAGLGFHHVHHLAPRVPNYRLEDCHNAHPDFAGVRVVTLRDALSAPGYLLWDEAAGRMLTFAEADRTVQIRRTGPGRVRREIPGLLRHFVARTGRLVLGSG